MDSTGIVNVQVPQTIVGLGAISSIGGTVKNFAPTKVLIVTDAGVVKAGILDAVKLPLEKDGYKFDIFDGCQVEAPISVIEELSQKVKAGKYDLLIGVGGGSTMDTTKVASIIAANDISVHNLISGKVAEKTIAKILVPTTAGTGAEWSINAVVTDDKVDGRTKLVITTQNLPNAVIVDPELTLNLPRRITADTGMDVLAHAIEAYTSCKANIVSDMLAETAIKLVAENLRPAYAKGSQCIEERYNLSIAASVGMLAGVVAGVGLAHFMNMALGKKAHISHGATVTLMLPYVMEFNLLADPAKFAKVAELMGENIAGLSTLDAAAKSVEAVRRLSQDLGMPQKLSDVGVTETDISELVEELITFATPAIELMNPRDVRREDVVKIYHAAL